jgi:CopG family transcriptional regulator, nickel-responsive regulator
MPIITGFTSTAPTILIKQHTNLLFKANTLGIISLSIPEELIKELDGILGEKKSATRSEVIRQALRTYISEYNKLNKIKGNVIATITVLYEKTEKNEEVFQLQHEFADMITAYLHSHLTGANCLEVLVVKGPAQRLKTLIDGLKANKPVRQIKFSIMTTSEEE